MPRFVFVAGAGASADQGLVVPADLPERAYRLRPDRDAVLGVWREAITAAQAEKTVQRHSRLVALARQLRAAGHQVVVGTTNVDGLLAREWPETIELHGSVHQDMVLDGEAVPRELEFRRSLAAADVVVVVGLSDYTTSVVQWILEDPPPRSPIWWVNPRPPNISTRRRSLEMFEQTFRDFVARPPPLLAGLDIWGPAGRTRSKTQGGETRGNPASE